LRHCNSNTNRYIYTRITPIGREVCIQKDE
jgi:hypothetical protein